MEPKKEERHLLDMESMEQGLAQQLFDSALSLNRETLENSTGIKGQMIFGDALIPEFVRKFSGLRLNYEVDGVTNTQAIDIGDVGVDVSFFYGDHSGIMLAFHKHFVPGDEVFVSYKFTNLPLALIREDGTRIPAEVLGDGEYFAFRIQAGGSFILEIV